MGKSYKFSHENQSAFNAYKENGNKAEIHTEPIEGTSHSDQAKLVVPSNSIIKNISHQAAFKLKHASSKKRKRLKKLNGNSGLVTDRQIEYWKPPSINDITTSTPLFTSNSNNKSFIFGFGKGGIRASLRGTKKGRNYTLPKIYENNKTAPIGLKYSKNLKSENSTLQQDVVYKDRTDHSIEMSTSQSLTGYDDDDESSNNSLEKSSDHSSEVDSNKNRVKKKPLNISIEIASSAPPCKKTKVSESVEKLNEIPSISVCCDYPSSETKKITGESSIYPHIESTGTITTFYRAITNIRKCIQSCLEPQTPQSSNNTVYVLDMNKSGTSTSITGSSTSLLEDRNGNFSILHKARKILKLSEQNKDSEKDGETILRWLIFPMDLNKFFSTMWEKKSFLIRRQTNTYTQGLFSTEEFNRILHENNIRYGVNLDVTSYQDGQRQTHNPEGRVFPAVAWDYYKNGCSLRFLNPQAYCKPVWELCATLQEYFKNVVGANVYLTPPGTQGFAPHYDDIEAFILQLEGRKHWKLYPARPGFETLPRYSSNNFTDDDIGKEMFEAILEPGDLLYFPRGVIHQGKSLPDTHSLHITISTYQRNTWGDVLEEVVPAALKLAISENVEFRKGLPLDYLDCLGYQNKGRKLKAERRKEMFSKVSDLFKTLADYVDLDSEADERASNLAYDSLPPMLSASEQKQTIFGASVSLIQPGMAQPCQFDIDKNTRVRLLRKNILRVVEDKSSDESVIIVFHSAQNPRVYHEEERKSFEVTEESMQTIRYLISRYPEYSTIENFPVGETDDKINLACGLFEKGVLMTEHPLSLVDEFSKSES